ncbi:holo-ACP synthase [Facklamia miroungae]|uniref:Holo-[acyl-carrier-protein] synthase n=1 Tax=Facklamia miroungae TaxID=120956 RepID=A0A1G7S2T4_9LACT|nr:holo-ACP synthase [Facklamia miroungae]NKZ29184.1 holo-ACP synthase [Facklamia miroungae]SDG17284.1 holo-[acyl-carrier protein] synthase [Facklamia miroungae]
MEIGIDIVEIDRIAKALDRHKAFPNKILSDQELRVFDKYPFQRQLIYLAGRFSAKEAYAKAIGKGIGRLRFTDLTILNDPMGRPKLVEGPIVEAVKISISHSHAYATAMVVIDCEQEIIDQAYLKFINQS